MQGTHRLISRALAVFLAIAPAAALAQETAGPFSNLQRRLKTDDVVLVVGPTGASRLGRVVEVTPDRLVLTELMVEKRDDRVLSQPGARITVTPQDALAILRSDLAATRGERLYGQDSFLELPRKLKVGQIAEITDLNGRRRRGTVTAVSEGAVSVRFEEWEDRTGRPAGTEQSFTPETVTRIRKVGALWDGAVKGAVVGFLIPILAGALQYEDGGAFLLPFAGMGAGVGVGIDALFGPSTVYRASGQARRMVVAPMIEKDRRGLTLSWSF